MRAPTGGAGRRELPLLLLLRCCFFERLLVSSTSSLSSSSFSSSSSRTWSRAVLLLSRADLPSAAASASLSSEATGGGRERRRGGGASSEASAGSPRRRRAAGVLLLLLLAALALLLALFFRLRLLLALLLAEAAAAGAGLVVKVTSSTSRAAERRSGVRVVRRRGLAVVDILPSSAAVLVRGWRGYRAGPRRRNPAPMVLILLCNGRFHRQNTDSQQHLFARPAPNDDRLVRSERGGCGSRCACACHHAAARELRRRVCCGPRGSVGRLQAGHGRPQHLPHGALSRRHAWRHVPLRRRRQRQLAHPPRGRWLAWMQLRGASAGHISTAPLSNTTQTPFPPPFPQHTGWCVDEDDCVSRSRTAIGSSSSWPSEGLPSMDGGAHGIMNSDPV